MRGAIANEMRAAMMNHELVTSTSIPASDPMRIVPGGLGWPAEADLGPPSGGV